MIKAVFYTGENGPAGFKIEGHSTRDERDPEGRLVCAGVSSAALLTANTLTEIIKANADVRCSDGFLSVRLRESTGAAETALQGLLLHLREMSGEYPDRIKVIMEVTDYA